MRFTRQGLSFPNWTKSRTSYHAHLKMGHNTEASPPTVLVPIAMGTEEIEAVTIVDTLVRAGAKVTVASAEAGQLQVVCSRGVKLCADLFIQDCSSHSWDLIVCPGGMPGAQRLRDSDCLTNLLKLQHEAKKPLAAICAAPAVIFSHHGIGDQKIMTGYPADHFKASISNYSADIVVVDGHVVTSQGPGTALAFALKLVEILIGPETATKLEREMLSQ